MQLTPQNVVMGTFPLTCIYTARNILSFVLFTCVIYTGQHDAFSGRFVKASVHITYSSIRCLVQNIFRSH